MQKSTSAWLMELVRNLKNSSRFRSQQTRHPTRIESGIEKAKSSVSRLLLIAMRGEAFGSVFLAIFLYAKRPASGERRHNDKIRKMRSNFVFVTFFFENT